MKKQVQKNYCNSFIVQFNGFYERKELLHF